jgi:hypothetical protein
MKIKEDKKDKDLTNRIIWMWNPIDNSKYQIANSKYQIANIKYFLEIMQSYSSALVERVC